MNNAEVVTYATHAQGKFDELINNKHDVPVKVLGWGDTWISYTESKIKGVYNYVKTLPEDKIIIFVDGFDSEIQGSLEEAVRRFKTFNTEIVVSQNTSEVAFGGLYTHNKTFGSCQQTILNSGLYMGYAGALSKLLNQMLLLDDEDDQRAMNTICSSSNNIAIDKDNLIFVNNKEGTDAIFISFPGCSDCDLKDKSKRYIRDISFYMNILCYEIIAALVISFGIFYCNKNIKCQHLPFVTFVVFIIMFLIIRNIPASFILRNG